MSLKIVNDLGAPLLVTAIDLTVESTAPEYSKWATGILAVGGYVGAYFNKGGDFVKNVGISALPACAKNVYDYFRAGTPAASRAHSLAFRRTSSRPVSSARTGISQTPGPGMDIIKPMY